MPRWLADCLDVFVWAGTAGSLAFILFNSIRTKMQWRKTLMGRWLMTEVGAVFLLYAILAVVLAAPSLSPDAIFNYVIVGVFGLVAGNLVFLNYIGFKSYPDGPIHRFLRKFGVKFKEPEAKLFNGRGKLPETEDDNHVQ